MERSHPLHRDAKADERTLSNRDLRRCGDNPDSPGQKRKMEQGWSQNLNDVVKMWPTPTTNDAKNATLPQAAKERDSIPGALMREGYTAQEGQLNPEWVEALMNFPPKWTEVD